jgi:hypothetical protein
MASVNDYGRTDIESLAQPKLGGTDGWAAAVAAALDGSDVPVSQRLAAKVSKSGDTMTGPLGVKNALNVNYPDGGGRVNFQRPGNPGADGGIGFLDALGRQAWFIQHEPDASGNLLIHRYVDGTWTSAPLQLHKDGGITLSGDVWVNGRLLENGAPNGVKVQGSKSAPAANFHTIPITAEALRWGPRANYLIAEPIAGEVTLHATGIYKVTITNTYAVAGDGYSFTASFVSNYAGGTKLQPGSYMDSNPNATRFIVAMYVNGNLQGIGNFFRTATAQVTSVSSDMHIEYLGPSA